MFVPPLSVAKANVPLEFFVCPEVVEIVRL
jgi:hypothetical protein